MRVVPRENEAINETWIADRDRFSYEGLYSRRPAAVRRMIRDGEEPGRRVDWEARSRAVAEGLQARSQTLGVLGEPSSTLEELYLLNRMARGLGSNNIDHRLRQRGFPRSGGRPGVSELGMPHRRQSIGSMLAAR